MAIPNGIDLASYKQDYAEACAWDIYNVTSERTVDMVMQLIYL